MTETTNQLEELTRAIDFLIEAIDNVGQTKGVNGYTIADSLEAIALEMSRANGLKEKELVSKDTR